MKVPALSLPPPAQGTGGAPNTTTSGMLLAGAGVPIAVARAAFGPLSSAQPWVVGVALALTALLLIAGAMIPRWPAVGRVLASLGIVGSLALGSPFLAGAPLITLTVLLVATASLALLWKVGGPLVGAWRPRERKPHAGRAQGAALMAVALWMLAALPRRNRSDLELDVVVSAGLAALVFALIWGLRERKRDRRGYPVVLVCALSALLTLGFWGNDWIVSAGLCVASLYFSLAIRAPQMAESGFWEPLLGHPERLFVGTFAALCALATLLLALPHSATSGRSVGLLDAAFTATSAVCVTGLIVLDTPHDFSGFGQLIILVFIQIGGLGIMTFSTAALWALGKRVSLRHEGAVASLISTRDRGRLFATAKRILLLTVLAEVAGAVLLSVLFTQHGDAWPRALWRGIFTAVSAFCNAGFALQSDSLIPYQSSPAVLHVVATLIVMGSLSPLAVLSIPALLSGFDRAVPLQAKLGLAAAAVLLVLGFLFVLAFEWDHSLRELSLSERLNNAWFQSVTLRTAGFNSIDTASVRPATLLLMMIWMFIGGSPGSTAGGIKTTTAFVLLLSVVQVVRGRWTLEAFGRQIPERTRTKAAVVASLAAAGIVAALALILLTQEMPAGAALFEVVSAFGTVGLSIGATADLDEIGKVIITACMFIGRVGGLTLLMFSSTRHPPKTIGRPEEEIDVG